MLIACCSVHKCITFKSTDTTTYCQVYLWYMPTSWGRTRCWQGIPSHQPSCYADIQNKILTKSGPGIHDCHWTNLHSLVGALDMAYRNCLRGGKGSGYIHLLDIEVSCVYTQVYIVFKNPVFYIVYMVC